MNEEKNRIPIMRRYKRIESQLNELATVRGFLGDLFRETPGNLLRQEDEEQLILAANEAVANIIKHAYQGRQNEAIEMEAEVFPDKIVLRLYHTGIPFDSENVPEPSFDGSRDGGFGVHIIRQCVDHVCYDTEKNGKTCILMVKTLKE